MPLVKTSTPVVTLFQFSTPKNLFNTQTYLKISQDNAAILRRHGGVYADGDSLVAGAHHSDRTGQSVSREQNHETQHRNSHDGLSLIYSTSTKHSTGRTVISNRTWSLGNCQTNVRSRACRERLTYVKQGRGSVSYCRFSRPPPVSLTVSASVAVPSLLSIVAGVAL